MTIYSISDIYPLFEYMHNQVGLSSDRYKTQNEIARTIWLAIRIDGEIKNGGIEQLFSNLGEHFDPACFTEALRNIGSENGLALVQEFMDFVYASETTKAAFYGEYGPAAFYKKLKKLHNDLSDQYYKLDPSVETQILKYAEANWNDPAFQEAIKDVVFKTEAKDESELIGSLNDAIKNGNIATAKKILKNLQNVNQSCQYGFVPMLELPHVVNPGKRIELCQLLLDHGADIGFRDKYGRTVLEKAAGTDKNDSFIEFLLDNGADIEVRDDYDNTPIFEANTNPENNLVLIRRGADLAVKNKIGFTPLSKALDRYHGWYGNPHAKEYHPKIKKVIDQLLDAGSVFQNEKLTRGNTEFSFFAEDPKMLKHLLKNKTVQNAPEFNANYCHWSAVFEASLKGNLECLKLLAEKGAHLNQPLEEVHYETKTFAGSTPLDVATSQEVKDFLLENNAAHGTRRSYALYLETRGTDENAVTELIRKFKNVDASEAKLLWNSVRRPMGPTYEKIDGEYVSYRPLFLTSSESEEEIKSLKAELKQLGCDSTLI